MSDYFPPLEDMRFVLEHIAGLENLPEHPDFGQIDADTAMSILEPAAKLAAEVLAPLNKTGDEKGCVLKDGNVTTPPGFKEAYGEYRDGGWNAVPFDSEYGGQALPWLMAFPLQEMWQGANMSFGLCPLLNQGAVEAIENHGSEEQKKEYLEKLISGQWTGTMNLTEPQAGSDLGQIRSKAEKQKDGTYKITGQKIYITYGEHDFADNIIHLVLARTPDAPEGVKGISLFIVPKFMSDGSRNDVVCTGIEHKLGIHASPTCTMQYGDQGGATGYLVGNENEGLKYMFTMMNNARLSVGLQGVAVAEAAYQKALAYAKERVQGTAIYDKSERIPISGHEDVKRMLLSMRAQVEAGRALAYEAALALDLARGGDKDAQAKADLLTPIVKSWCTDMACDVASTGIQVHGGMGYVEETGAAQFLRDARILPIYEGTNGIQAADLVFRKVARDQGESALSYIDSMKYDLPEPETAQLLADATRWIADMAEDTPEAVAAVSVPYLNAFALMAGGALMGRAGKAAQKLIDEGHDDPFYTNKLVTVRYFQDHLMPQAITLSRTVVSGSASILWAEF